MKAEIWAEVGDAVAGGGPTPKLEAALGNILAGRSNHFPRPPPQKRAPSDTSSDASSLQSKENRSPRRRLRRDLLPSDSDVSEPPTPTTKPASDFFRRAARRAYAPAKEDPRFQLRRALVDALLKCADATSAAQLVRNDGPVQASEMRLQHRPQSITGWARRSRSRRAGPSVSSYLVFALM